jgi:hypothetical protein
MMIQPSSTVVNTTTMTIIIMRHNTMTYSNFLRKACIEYRNIGDGFGCQGGFHFKIDESRTKSNDFYKIDDLDTLGQALFIRLPNDIYKKWELRIDSRYANFAWFAYMD